MGTLLRSCAEVHEPIELSFGVVSGVGQGIHVLDGFTCPKKKKLFWEFFDICASVGLNGH